MLDYVTSMAVTGFKGRMTLRNTRLGKMNPLSGAVEELPLYPNINVIYSGVAIAERQC
jgi:hypothetical protein